MTLGLLAPLPPPQSQPSSLVKLDPPEVFARVHKWWDDNGIRQLATYEARIYPSGPLRLTPQAPGQDRAARREWLKLFISGITQTMVA